MLPHDQVDIYAWVDSEIGDFLDNAGRAVDVDDSLVDSHLKPVPSLGPLSAGRLSSRDLQDLGRNTHRPLGLVALVAGS